VAHRPTYNNISNKIWVFGGLVTNCYIRVGSSTGDDYVG